MLLGQKFTTVAGNLPKGTDQCPICRHPGGIPASSRKPGTTALESGQLADDVQYVSALCSAGKITPVLGLMTSPSATECSGSPRGDGNDGSILSVFDDGYSSWGASFILVTELGCEYPWWQRGVWAWLSACTPVMDLGVKDGSLSLTSYFLSNPFYNGPYHLCNIGNVSQ